MQYSLGELAARVDGEVIGDASRPIKGVATLAAAGPDEITFFTNRRYRKQLETTRAAAVIVGAADAPHCPVNALVAANPYLAYARIAAAFAPALDTEPGIHPTAVVSPDASVAPDATIGPAAVVAAGAAIENGARIGAGCYIGHGSRIGADSRLAANVVVYHGVRIGKRVIIHAGAVIGSDGFGFAPDQGRWVKVPQLGGVVIADDVEIGANTTIDRGAIEDTVIEEGVKLDNLIQVAHNVRIGAHTAMAGCVGIAGSTTIGRQCAIGGGVGIIGHLEIADRVTVTAMSLVTKSITEPGVYSSGTPLEPNERWHKNFARYKQLDEMARRIKALEKEIENIKTKG